MNDKVKGIADFDLNNPRNTNCPECSGEVMEGDVREDSGTMNVYCICVKCGWNAPKCEVYSRVVGYLRPVTQWNDGKKAEFDMRKEYKVFKEAIDENKTNK